MKHILLTGSDFRCLREDNGLSSLHIARHIGEDESLIHAVESQYPSVIETIDLKVVSKWQTGCCEPFFMLTLQFAAKFFKQIQCS
jgi:hypothetical protein